VRLNDSERNPLASVYLGLSDDEAVELIGALTTLKSARAGWHEHVSDESSTREITVYREDDASAILGATGPSSRA
jgi:hypothetical protein